MATLAESFEPSVKSVASKIPVGSFIVYLLIYRRELQQIPKARQIRQLGHVGHERDLDSSILRHPFFWFVFATTSLGHECDDNNYTYDGKF
jgi:hypothetical protein